MRLKFWSALALGIMFSVNFVPLAKAGSGGIQMLPPVTEATKSTTHTACPEGGTPNLLTWDGTNPITCAAGVQASGGTIIPGNADPSNNTPFRIGNSCPQEGALGYDLTAHSPVYCNVSGKWSTI